MTVREHLIRYPQARTSTVRYLVAREAKTKQLQQEIEQAEAQRKLHEFRDSIGWKRPAIIGRMLNALGIGRL